MSEAPDITSFPLLLLNTILSISTEPGPTYKLCQRLVELPKYCELVTEGIALP